MDYVSLCGIAVGLAMDAFAVSITNGAVTKRVTPRFAFKVALCFGLFQAGMPAAGWLVGKAGESIIKAVDHWIALILLSYIGISMIVESHSKKSQVSNAAGRTTYPQKRCLCSVWQQALTRSPQVLSCHLLSVLPQFP